MDAGASGLCDPHVGLDRDAEGVAIPHRGVVRLVRENSYAELNAEHTFLQQTPICFDVSTFEIWGPLLNGAQLVIMPPRTSTLEELGRGAEQIST